MNGHRYVLGLSSARSFSLLVLTIYGSLILTGGFLLYLSELHEVGSLSFFESLFNSVSAVSGTGFTLIGSGQSLVYSQLIILVLIQSGAWVAITIAVLLITMIRKHATHRSPVKIFLQVVAVSLLIEAIGAGCIFMMWSQETVFSSSGQKLAHAVFLSVSSFCHAGFSNCSVTNDKQVMVQLAMLPVLFMGSIGFLAIRDMFSIPRLRNRLDKPHLSWETNTRVGLVVTGTLMMIGSGCYFIFESGNAGEKLVERVVNSLFFALTVNDGMFTPNATESFHPFIMCLLLVLMFVGTSSASNGGGIKTSSLAVMSATCYATWFTKKTGKLVNPDLWNSTRNLLVYAAGCLLLGSVAMVSAEKNVSFFDSLFNSISAFTNSGFYTGNVYLASDFTQVILMLLMLAGKPGFFIFLYIQLKKFNTTQVELLPG